MENFMKSVIVMVTDTVTGNTFPEIGEFGKKHGCYKTAADFVRVVLALHRTCRVEGGEMRFQIKNVIIG